MQGLEKAFTQCGLTHEFCDVLGEKWKLLNKWRGNFHEISLIMPQNIMHPESHKPKFCNFTLSYEFYK